jgi:hypothetical protein
MATISHVCRASAYIDTDHRSRRLSVTPNKQFIVLYDAATRRARFVLRFAAPGSMSPVDSGSGTAGPAGGECAHVTIATGDGNLFTIGRVCSPSLLEWRFRDEIEVGAYTYTGKGPHVAALTWGDERYEAAVNGGRSQSIPVAIGSVLATFQAKRDVTDPWSVTIRLRADGMARDQRLRVDSGAGEVFWLDASMAGAENALIATYHKLGAYTIAVDLVDAQGFRIVTLGETSIEITDDEPEQLFMPPPPGTQRVPAQLRSDPNVPLTQNSAEPWNPFRYARPNWAAVKTYRKPDGYVSRTLGNGVYLAVRQEVATGGQLWYETGAYDWVPATSVTLVTPSKLRGVMLDGSPAPGVNPAPKPVEPTQPTEPTAPVTPTSPTPPNPSPTRPPTTQPNTKTGVVIAGVLNVRTKPGIAYGNEPTEVLRYGDKVIIHEEMVVAGVKWYRIDANKWVHAGYVRLTNSGDEGAPPGGKPDTNIPVGAPMLDPTPQYKPVQMPIGWVVPDALVVRKQPGEEQEVIGNLSHNQVVQILEEVEVNKVLWYRIGRDQWVDSNWIGAARIKPRPKNIRANERWVGVCLKEQTAIAYEGDTPLFAALVATGVQSTPTVQGVFRTWWRLTSRRMTGPGYYLEEVTWTEYFHGGYALHTAYWHDVFGRPRSHGCVNLSPYDAWWIHEWSAAGGSNAPTVYSYWA